MATTDLRILVLEDDAPVAVPVEARLRQAGLLAVFHRVPPLGNAVAGALDEFAPEVVACSTTVALSLVRGPDPLPPVADVTPRQYQVLQLLADGLATREIARRLGLSVKTIETHRAQLMRRLQIRTVAGLVRYALQTGIARPNP